MRLLGVPAILAIATAPSIASDGPLVLKGGMSVSRVDIRAYPKGRPKVSTVLSDPMDIEFVVRNLTNLKSRMYDHSSPQIDITLSLSNGDSVRFRVSPDEIGPDAPASAWNKHWFPKDRSLFDFLLKKAYPSSPGGAGQPNHSMQPTVPLRGPAADFES